MRTLLASLFILVLGAALGAGGLVVAMKHNPDVRKAVVGTACPCQKCACGADCKCVEGGCKAVKAEKLPPPNVEKKGCCPGH